MAWSIVVEHCSGMSPSFCFPSFSRTNHNGFIFEKKKTVTAFIATLLVVPKLFQVPGPSVVCCVRLLVIAICIDRRVQAHALASCTPTAPMVSSVHVVVAALVALSSGIQPVGASSSSVNLGKLFTDTKCSANPPLLVSFSAESVSCSALACTSSQTVECKASASDAVTAIQSAMADTAYYFSLTYAKGDDTCAGDPVGGEALLASGACISVAGSSDAWSVMAVVNDDGSATMVSYSSNDCDSAKVDSNTTYASGDLGKCETGTKVSASTMTTAQYLASSSSDRTAVPSTSAAMTVAFLSAAALMRLHG